MRWSIIAGLIMGASLGAQSAVGAHIRAKAFHAASAVRVHVKEVAPWYIAVNDHSRRSLFPRPVPFPTVGRG